MTRILAINCGHETVDRLRADQRFEVVEASYTSDDLPASHPLGDPRSYDILLFDDEGPSPSSISAAAVNQRFEREAEQGGAVSLEIADGYRPETMTSWDTKTQSGFNLPALTAADGSALPYVDTFLDRFGDSFETRVLEPPYMASGFRVLATNSYDQAMIVVQEGSGDRLVRYVIPATSSSDQTASTILGFIDLVLLPLHPELLADQFTPAIVTALQDAVARADSDHMKKRTALESQIRAEQEYFARHAPLKTEMNEALKERVKAALEETFRLKVTDLDDVYEDKNADLWLDDHGIVIEARGSKRRNATEDDVEDVVDHTETLTGLGRQVRGKVLLFNGQLGRLQQDRSSDVFSSGVTREAQKAGVTLMTGDDLLRLVELARLGQYETETLIETMRTPGRFQGIPEPRIEL